MLEIKNVTKIYKTKGGVDTKALDNVSISFGETGLVFLLGKSGSGKSTLLNVCGGLDEPTSGEVIVKGKSSKDFSGSDFDSYRNTFVGFIFQEYNVLDEFNVEDNIALALELQGKPKDKEKITKILQEVELGIFAKRKPNTLSGGQKQRIAIARALVKEPQIIMADEPTGALDSATGKQVFDTLKKLSQTRLVIVVSHDREFAEIYGDRIVELKDGKIISDVTKSEIPPDTIDENVTVIGGSTLSIKSGSKLTQSNLKAIQDFVLGSESDVIITKGEKEITAFKKANRMKEGGATETFNDTNPQDIVLKEYTKEDSKFIRSRLPAGKAIKIGASGLKLKPVRLIFTILLSFIAFTMFGLFSTLMLYDGDKVTVNSYMESDYDFFNITKYYISRIQDENWSYTIRNEINFTDEELKEFSEKYGDATFGYYGNAYNSYSVDSLKVKTGRNQYYYSNIDKFAYLPEGHKLRADISGAYPVKSDEVCISSYLVEVMKNSEVYKVTVGADGKTTIGSEKITVNSEEDIIGNYIAMAFNGEYFPFKVTGVFQSGEISHQYDELMDTTDGANTNYMLAYEFQIYLQEGLFKLMLVSDNFYDTYEQYGIFGSSNKYINYFDGYYNNTKLIYPNYDYNCETGDWYEFPPDSLWWETSLKVYGNDNTFASHFFGGENKTSLSDFEIVIGVNYLDSSIFYKPLMQYFMGLIESGAYDNDERFFIQEKLSEDDITYDEWDEEQISGYYSFNFSYYYTYEEYLDAYNLYYNECVYRYALNLYNELVNNICKYRDGHYFIGGYYFDEDAGVWVEEEWVSASEAERLQALTEIIKVTDNLQPVDAQISIDGFEITATFVGFHECDIYTEYNDSGYGAYVSQYLIDNYFDGDTYNFYTEETNYVEEEGCIYSGLYVAYDKSEKAIKDILATVGVENVKDNDVGYSLNSSLYSSISFVNQMAEILSTVFLWVGLVFAIFSALLMFNFISVSISNKRKEIGILRAVGARGTDVFKIFFAESGIIVGICTVLALIAAFLGCIFLNNVLKAEIGLEVTLFVFGIASVAIMVAIALLVAFISTFLPVYFAARKKPVDSIRAL